MLPLVIDLHGKTIVLIKYKRANETVPVDTQVIHEAYRQRVAIKTTLVHVEQYRVAAELLQVDALSQHARAVAVQAAGADDSLFL